MLNPGDTIVIDGKHGLRLGRALGGGGEGTVFELTGDSRVVKIYTQPPGGDQIAKLTCMITSPPDDPERAKGHASIAWPLALARRGGTVVGFAMPRAPAGKQLTFLINPRDRKAWVPHFTWQSMLVVARNLASAFGHIHAKGYVIGDVKPENLQVTEQSLITVLDTDSFQVHDRAGGVLHTCDVFTSGYTPPEWLLSLARQPRRPEEDCFGLAVIIYKLIMAADAHPFCGRWAGPGDPPSNDDELVRNGWYTHRAGSFMQPRASVLPISAIPPQIAELFDNCFIRGHNSPSSRPSAMQWLAALDGVIQGTSPDGPQILQRCRTVSTHMHVRGIACPWCQLKSREQVDYFPAKAATARRPARAHAAACSAANIPTFVPPPVPMRVAAPPPLAFVPAANVPGLVPQATPASPPCPPHANGLMPACCGFVIMCCVVAILLSALAGKHRSEPRNDSRRSTGTTCNPPGNLPGDRGAPSGPQRETVALRPRVLGDQVHHYATYSREGKGVDVGADLEEKTGSRGNSKIRKPYNEPSTKPACSSKPVVCLQPDTTREAVISRMGEPKGYIRVSSKEILYYEQGDVILENGKVIAIENKGMLAGGKARNNVSYSRGYDGDDASLEEETNSGGNSVVRASYREPAIRLASLPGKPAVTRLQPGISRESVISLLGEPNGYIRMSPKEVLSYEGLDIILENDRVISIKNRGLLAARNNDTISRSSAHRQDARSILNRRFPATVR